MRGAPSLAVSHSRTSGQCWASPCVTHCGQTGLGGLEGANLHHGDSGKTTAGQVRWACGISKLNRW